MVDYSMTLRLCSRCEKRRPTDDLIEQNGVRMCEGCLSGDPRDDRDAIRSESLPSLPDSPGENDRRAADHGYDLAEHQF